jgi:ribokinase
MATVTPSVCVVGSLNLDLVVRVARMPRTGETVRGSGVDHHLGGKGLNQAVAARRSGAEVAMVGCVGDDDFGRRLLAGLAAEGIDHAGVATVAGPTGVAVPLVDEQSGDNAIVVVAGANGAMDAPCVALAEEAIRAAAVVVLQFEIPMDGVVAAADIARDGGAQVVLNPSPAATLPDRLVGLIDVLVVNETELAALGPGNDDHVDEARAVAQRWELGAVVVTLGARGALAVTARGQFRVAPHQVEVVDTVGAGDAFCGALAAALAAGEDLAGAVVRGNAAGALACTVRGAVPAMPTAAAVDRLLAG